ncbi:MAG: hypothetical protein H7249_00875 [Chitinophagaceae bacterium]|nr:hypothetical protein [Oligoflexus sp.]
MLESQFEIVDLKSGIKSLRLIENNETFHPGIGPIAEANILHVAQHRFAERVVPEQTFVLWDVGLGAAANVVAAIDALKDLSSPIEIHSFDRSLGALRFALEHLDALDYLAPYHEAATRLMTEHVLQLTPHIRWFLHVGDFRDEMLNPNIPTPDSIFYDPYSPRGNVDMWNLDHFRNLRTRVGDTKTLILTNYTRATYVRVTWLLAGFFVGVGTSIGEKEETSVASNSLDALKAPLQDKFLQRVRVSHSSAPLRGPAYSTGPIDTVDCEAVMNHPQFQTH